MFKPDIHNPILKPLLNSPWQSRKVYNPAVVAMADGYQMLYRAVGEDGISRLGRASSSDGINWQQESVPCFVPDSNFEIAGVEDPRIVALNGTYLMTYTAYDGITARLSIAKSDDLVTWKRFGPILPSWDRLAMNGFIVADDPAQLKSTNDWSKSGALFDRKIADKYYLLFGDSCIWLSTSSDGLSWVVEANPILSPRSGFFDSYFVEMGPPPIKIDDGWLVLYHGVDHQLRYGIGVAWLDDNLKLLKRCDEPLLIASQDDSGPLVDINDNQNNMARRPQVIYATGSLLLKQELRIYYGMADALIGSACDDLTAVLSVLKNVL